MKDLVKVSLRQNAVYIPAAMESNHSNISENTSVLIANLSKLGFGVSEDLLKALNNTTASYQTTVFECFKEIMGVDKNWTPLVKNWKVPTGESYIDHVATFFANVFQTQGTALECGHIIPSNTFPLERYNGCPFCGTPFQFDKLILKPQGSKKKVLELWTDNELNEFYSSLLSSKTALDATQVDSLKTLLNVLPLPSINVAIKETLMLVIDTLVEAEKPSNAQPLFKTPTDILRYLWYKQTGFLQIVEPQTIIKRKQKNNKHIRFSSDASGQARILAKEELKLKYSRKECLMVATWINNLEGDAEKLCEMMHPKRGMWVRFIRALRLAEYSKKEGFFKLKELLDVFYNSDYDVWQGRVNYYRLRSDAQKTFVFLKQRPGLFARSLFSNMLWFGPELTITQFSEVVDKVPTRLILTLNMYAQNYFDPANERSVKPLGGTNKRVAANNFLKLYNENELFSMKKQIEYLTFETVKTKFENQETQSQTIYIDPALFNMPLAIGDRSETVQDIPAALMGTRFPVEGNSIRLFMQWGMGLPAQHLDMDLSCFITYSNRTEFCSFSNLSNLGCKHSGDIIYIPHMIGTAEYIEIDVLKLKKAGARYVIFTCNAYSRGSISPNLVVGWMDSKFPMSISERSGVAYDPSCVQHQIRVTGQLTKGLIFGVLDVANEEVVWLETSFNGQLVQNLDEKGVKSLLARLKSKMSIGNFLKIKAEAQGLSIVDDQQADEVYTRQWGLNSAGVTKLFVD